MQSANQSPQQHRREAEQPTVRPFEPADRGGFLDLYEDVWGTRKDAAWFDWRFGDNPYVDDVPGVVVEQDGAIVGAEPCLVFRLAAGEETVLAYQPADWMVHSEYRRQGLFSRMTEALLERYDENGPDLYFNFPSEAILPGLESFGWQVLGRMPAYYRIQDASALVGATSASGATATLQRALGYTGSPLLKGFLSLRNGSAADSWTVSRHEQIPVETLIELYQRSVPEQIHVRRDAAFYGWRFENPRWETTTYVADRDGDAVAAVVVARESGDLEKVSVLDVLPVDGSAPEESYEALLSAVVSDASDVDVIKCGAETMPESVLRGLGFRADDTFPLSYVSKSTTSVVRPASGDVEAAGTWELAGQDVTDPESWRIQLGDQDVC
ncbi:GNAT family N-acetyltransferase [Halobaculum limi]|uniref:GNAT family N-acetyltransferase n=1 Tax=Halobaculum limi TaxID=3031916 RepID=UPI002406F85E|nr:GNAT family N-acetyltransferase [Halobaculum sp. YSMS11]